MTELYIDKQQVVLPETFSITIIEENPFFTKNGKYTYDISLSLLDPVNARIYKHLNRMNRKGDIPQHRTAYLVVDNEVVLNGTEVILEYTDREVKIQLVSGNSELNFLIGGDRKIRDMDLGKAEIKKGNDAYETAKLILHDLQLPYPDNNWLLLPYATDDFHYKEGSGSSAVDRPIIGNYYLVINSNFWNSEGAVGGYDPLYTGSYSGYVPQPYFCFIIEQMVKSLGYNLEYNALAEHEVWRYAYIVNGLHTYEFAKMLPDWTVNEFITKIELQFDCTFLVDPDDRSVRLMFNYQNNTDTFGVSELEALDEYVVEPDEENRLNVQNSNVSYSFDNDDYYSYMNLDQRIRDAVDRINGYVQFVGNLNEIFDKIGAGDWSKDIIYKTSDTISHFIKYDSGLTNPTVRKIDSFRPLYNNLNSTEIDHEFDIIPAPMIYFDQWAEADLGSNKFWTQVPVAYPYDSLYDNHEADPIDPDQKINVQEMIDNNSSITESLIPSKIRLALYNGLKKMNVKQLQGGDFKGDSFYPMAFVEYLDETLPDAKNVRYFGPVDQDPFRLENMNKDIYSKTLPVDTTNPYKMDFIFIRKNDIKNKYIIKNKSFKCFKIERVATNKGFNKKAKGYFYPYS